MDELGPRLNKIGDPDEPGPYPAMPYFFRDIGQPAFGQPISGLPEDHPLTLAQANVSQRIYGPAVRTALGYVGRAGENYDPNRPECRAVARPDSPSGIVLGRHSSWRSWSQYEDDVCGTD